MYPLNVQCNRLQLLLTIEIIEIINMSTEKLTIKNDK